MRLYLFTIWRYVYIYWTLVRIYELQVEGLIEIHFLHNHAHAWMLKGANRAQLNRPSVTKLSQNRCLEAC
jgi:hypothetical protein